MPRRRMTTVDEEEDEESSSPQQSHAPSDVSTSRGSTLSRLRNIHYKKCNLLMIVAGSLIIVGVGWGIGWGITQSSDRKYDDDEANSENDNNSLVESTALKYLDANDYLLYGVNLEETIFLNDTITNKKDCWEYCQEQEYEGSKYLAFAKSCTCYKNIDCIMEWGNAVDSDKYLFSGDLHVSDNNTKQCNEPFCQVNGGNDPRCFTGNTQSYQTYSLYGMEMIETNSTTITTALQAGLEEECLEFCAEYDAASFVNFKFCTCFNKVDCWLDWGQDQVNTQFLFGTVYSKQTLDICPDITYCDVNQDEKCFTANSKDYKEYLLDGVDMVERDSTITETDDKNACLNYCAAYDAVKFELRKHCTCYDNVDCWMEWGSDQVDTQLVFGTIFSNKPLPVCAFTYCQVHEKEDGLCFTANSHDFRDYSLFGEGMMEMVTYNDTTKDACLDLCAPYDAAAFLDFTDCICLNNVDCRMEWGNQVDTDVLYGSIFSKQALEVCPQDYCQANSEDALCFTANLQDYKQYTLLQGVIANSTKTSEKEECLNFCAPYSAVSFVNWQDCTCYETATCWTEWGDSVDSSSFFGTVYSKSPLTTCPQDYCQANNSDVLCFTGNNRDSRDYSLGGLNMTIAKTSNDMDNDECLSYCADHDGASYWLFQTPKCTCYDQIDCWNETTYATNDTTAFAGTVYSKTPLGVCSL